MTKKIAHMLSMIGLLFPSILWASGKDSLYFTPVLDQTAYVSFHRQLNKSFWDPLSYGLTPRIELQTYPLVNLIMPNLGVKINYAKSRSAKLQWASSHSISHFSKWLTFWQGDGTGKLITPEISVPDMAMLKTGVITTYVFSRKHIGSIGIEHSFIIGSQIDPMYTVDLPLVFPRFAPAFLGPVFTFKTNVQGVIYKRLQYVSHLNYHYIQQKEFVHFSELYCSLVYATDTHFKLSAGSNLVYGTYPFGTQWHLLPYLNLYYTLNLHKNSK